MKQKECLCIPVSCYSEYTCIILRCWKDHKDLAQGLVVYDAVTDCVSAYCQLGNELSEQVRKASHFQCCFKFNILHTHFQCKILLGFSVCNFKANSTNIYHNFLSNPIVLRKWTCNIGCPKIHLTIQCLCSTTTHNIVP